jgi:LacI family transcriptional regulator
MMRGSKAPASLLLAYGVTRWLPSREHVLSMAMRKPSPPLRVESPVVRLSEVAKLAQCSTATVSRVLNTPHLVKTEVRERVHGVVQQLGYTRNAAASALRSRRSQTVGAVIPTLNHAIYARLVGELQDALAAEGYSLLVTTSEFSQQQELKQIRILVARGVDGLVLVGHSHSSEVYPLLAAEAIPYVNTYTYSPDTEHPSIGFDNSAATAQITTLLLDLGHRDFAVMAGFRADNDRVSDRIKGVVTTLADAGLSLPEDRIIEQPYTIDGGRDGLRYALRLNPRPTALICGSDVLAFGAVIECNSRKVAVPRDLSIVGFDNLEYAAHLSPPLTTLEVPAAEMGRRAGDYLIGRLRGRVDPKHIPLKTSLILRQTTAPPPARR